MAKKIDEYSWQEIPEGAVVLEPGNATSYKTGDWRTLRPQVNFEACIKCAVCWSFCPEGCIFETGNGYFVADLDYCKGCGICAKECYTGCITMVEG